MQRRRRRLLILGGGTPLEANDSVGTAAGVGTATGVTSSQFNSVGTSAGTSTAVAKPNLILNSGPVFTSTAHWTAGFEDFDPATGGGTVTVVAGDLVVDNASSSGDNTVAVTETLFTELGVTYNCSVDRSNAAGQDATNGQMIVYDTNPLEGFNAELARSVNITAGGTDSFTFTGVGATVWVRLGHFGTGTNNDSRWNNLSVVKGS